MHVYQFQDYHLRMTVSYGFLFPKSARLHACGEFLVAWKEDPSLRPSQFHEKHERENPASPGFRTFVNTLHKIERATYGSLPDLLLSFITNKEAILSYLALHPLRQENEGSGVYAEWTCQKLHEALQDGYGTDAMGLSIMADESYVRKIHKEFSSNYLAGKNDFAVDFLGVLRIERNKPSISFPEDAHYTRAVTCELKFFDLCKDDSSDAERTLFHRFPAQVPPRWESSKQIYRKGCRIALAYASLYKEVISKLPAEIQTVAERQLPSLIASMGSLGPESSFDVLMLIYPSPFSIRLIDELRRDFSTIDCTIDTKPCKLRFRFALASNMTNAGLAFNGKLLTTKTVPQFEVDIFR